VPSSLLGRRIHITGSINEDLSIASAESVEAARNLVGELVRQLMKKGASFVVPVDAEPQRECDNLPICFDWLVWEAIFSTLSNRPAEASIPLAVAVVHHKTKKQIPPKYLDLWEKLKGSNLLQIDNVAEWNMASKRMEAQAQRGEILIALGGGEGTCFLANRYHEAGKPVIPLNLPLCKPDEGAIKIYKEGLTRGAQRLFNTKKGRDEDTWLNYIDNPENKPASDLVPVLIDLLESLNPPKAFAVRLIDREHDDFNDVDTFFKTIVDPVVSQIGYDLVTVDSKHEYKSASINQEIFNKLHKSRFVICDITGVRPNCFIELGYAFGRNIPTILTAKKGTDHPFDITVYPAHHWTQEGSVNDRQQAFREHVDAMKYQDPLVSEEPLIV
jgi:hypothetical protein